VPEMTPREVSEFFKIYGKKARFLADENLDPELVHFLRVERWNLKGAVELGLRGHPDENLFALAVKDDRVLFTKDRDFLNDRRYPLQRSPGIVVLPDDATNFEAFLNAVAAALTVVGRLREFYRYSKVEINHEGIMTIAKFERDTGEVSRWRVRVNRGDEVEAWDDGLRPNRE
jgi:predicted nuclease of predicted toxin-antitoxin system